jgi:hypothetical protein
MTMVRCGEFFKLSHDTDLFAYFRAHYRSFSPPPQIAHSLCGKPPTAGHAKPPSSGAWSREAGIPQPLSR